MGVPIKCLLSGLWTQHVFKCLTVWFRSNVSGYIIRSLVRCPRCSFQYVDGMCSKLVFGIIRCTVTHGARKGLWLELLDYFLSLYSLHVFTKYIFHGFEKDSHRWPIERPCKSDKRPVHPNPCRAHWRHPVDSALGCRRIGLWKGHGIVSFWVVHWLCQLFFDKLSWLLNIVMKQDSTWMTWSL